MLGEYDNPVSQSFSFTGKKPKPLHSSKLFDSSPKSVQVWKVIHVC